MITDIITERKLNGGMNAFVNVFSHAVYIFEIRDCIIAYKAQAHRNLVLGKDLLTHYITFVLAFEYEQTVDRLAVVPEKINAGFKKTLKFIVNAQLIDIVCRNVDPCIAIIGNTLKNSGGDIVRHLRRICIYNTYFGFSGFFPEGISANLEKLNKSTVKISESNFVFTDIVNINGFAYIVIFKQFAKRTVFR